MVSRDCTPESLPFFIYNNMEQLIKIKKSEGGKDIVSARELYQFLECTERFSNWFERHLQYGFTEHIDYEGCKEFNTLANQELIDYAITMDCAKEISMLQRSERGKEARLYFIAMEKAALKNAMALPQTFAQALQLAADQAKQIELQNTQIKELAPKAEIFDKIVDSTGLKTIGEVAKTLGTGEKRLFSWLREQHILMTDFFNKNVPYQKYIEQGYFEVKTGVIESINKNYAKTYVTSKGELWLAKIWKRCHELSLNNL
jgi:anti-repressor protein